MPSSRVEVLSDPVPGFSDLASLERLVSRAVEAALAAEHTAGPDQVAVLLSDDERLRALNLEFNGADEVTDVLSFNEEEGWRDGVPPAESPDDGFRMPGEEPRLGDIVISLPQTKRQSEQHGVPFERELAMLAIHGVLHLLGYDHAEPEEERVMFGKTEEVLQEVFAGRDET
jgi:probable rRNA maturation factor